MYRVLECDGEMDNQQWKGLIISMCIRYNLKSEMNRDKDLVILIVGAGRYQRGQGCSDCVN